MKRFANSLMGSAALAAMLAVMSGAAPAATAPPVKITRLTPAQPSQVAPEQVSVLVFFDFKPASKTLLKRLLSWAQNAGGGIVLDREPLVASDKAPLAHAFMVARTLGVTANVLPALFDLAQGRPVNNGKDGKDVLKSAIANIFASAGINEIEFNAAWNSAASDNGLLRARSMAERFDVNGAPLLVVNGLWKLDPGAGASVEVVVAALASQVDKVRERILAEQ